MIRKNVATWALCGVGALMPLHSQALTLLSPNVKTPTTFAIVIDQKSYDNAKAEVDAYRAAIEADGLGTYLIVDEWTRPEPIREQLMALHADKKAPLEGCVLVGDVPIAMVRDAQHLSSAFKMNQAADWKKSSIPSDRYYDDFGLTFDYIKQDSIVPAYHYMTLRPDSKQYISPDIYSARIRPLAVEGMDKHEQLRAFMRKAVAEKQSGNKLDHLTMARGHGYNSEDPIAWAGEQMALREQLPALFHNGEVKFYDFGMKPYVKNDYLTEVARPELDIMLFHHHGSPTMQYLSGTPAVTGVTQSIENAKQFLRSKVPGTAKRVGREAAVKEYAERYGVPEWWCEEAFDSALIAKDSIINLGMDIYTTDIREVVPNARFVLLDACYNGSFHMDDYVAGSYIFSPGKTVAAIGCTVNTIQDKWPDEFIGLMEQGMRIGQFLRFTCFLENHMSGDPTLRFENDGNVNINRDLVLREGDVKYWTKQLRDSKSADMQAMALRQLSMADAPGLPKLLKNTYDNSDNFVVRLEALRLLALNYPEQAASTIAKALNDNYELTRRFASEYVELNADESLIEPLVKNYYDRSQEPRQRFRLQGAVNSFPHQEIASQAKTEGQGRQLRDTAFVSNLLKFIDRQETSIDELITDISVDSAYTAKQMRNGVSRFRNKPVKNAIIPLMTVIKAENQPIDVRVAAAEALGWYNLYHDKQAIIELLTAYEATEPELNSEITKTINRLKSPNR